MFLPILRPDQWEILSHPAKVKVLPCGRRWGKTVLGGTAAGLALKNHGKVAWVAPTYKNSRPLWRWILAATADDVKAKRMRINRSERTIETRRGGLLSIYSGDNIDAMRGEFFHLVVADEAARLPESGWTEVILPTLADVDGWAYLISTPMGRNWFYQEFMRGEMGEDGFASWQRPTSDNPMPAIRKAYDMARGRVSEDVFAQEWDAQFSEAGMVFRKVREAAVLAQQSPADGARYVHGVDVGRKQDYTVVTAIDPKTKQMVAYHRVNKLDWEVQADQVAAFIKRYSSMGTLVETNGVGDPFLEMLNKRGVSAAPFNMSNASKYEVITALQAGFDHKQLQIVNDPVMVGELEMFESGKTPGGRMSFSAPEGKHDDCVISLALAWQLARHDYSIKVTKGRI